MSETFQFPEPEWILDKSNNGHLIWRRENCDGQEKTPIRVKFKHDVEVKEFYRKSYELIEPPWLKETESTNLLTMSFTCIFCLTVSFILPWYILAGGTFH